MIDSCLPRSLSLVMRCRRLQKEVTRKWSSSYRRQRLQSFWDYLSDLLGKYQGRNFRNAISARSKLRTRVFPAVVRAKPHTVEPPEAPPLSHPISPGAV